MKGEIRGGTMTVTLNINYEKLAAPGHEKHWLPCADCGEMQIVDRLVVGGVCDDCAKPGVNVPPLPTGHQPGCFCVLCQAAERVQERNQRRAESDDDVLHLDRWGCVVWIEGEALLCCEANTYAESGKADACELTAPESQEILDAINEHFGTAYQLDEFAGR